MRPHSLLVSALLTLTAAGFGIACSDDNGGSSASDADKGGNSGDGDSGGNSGDGDSGGSSGDGDGDPSTGAEGSAHYVIDIPDPSVGVCGVTSVGGIGDSVGNVPDLPMEGDSPTFFGRPVADGEPYNSEGAAYQIECSVSGTASHTIEVTMRGPNHSPFADDAIGETSIEISGEIALDGTGWGSVTYRTMASGSGMNPVETPCALSAVPHPQGGFFEIGDGEARFTFTCPETILAQDDLGRCEASGTIWVTGCSQP